MNQLIKQNCHFFLGHEIDPPMRDNNSFLKVFFHQKHLIFYISFFGTPAVSQEGQSPQNCTVAFLGENF